MTIFSVLPEIWLPDLVTLLVTATAMNAGSGPFGGGALLPGSVVQVVPHDGVAGFLANPLKADGEEPAVVVLLDDHWLPQKVTELPIAALPLPITKAPLPLTAA